MFKLKHIAVALAAGAAVLGVTACDPSQVPTPTPAPRVVDATETPWVAPTSVLPVAADPLSTDGTWLVPSEIAPGTYKATPTDELGGYWALCADLACEIDGDGDDTTGLIDNAIVSKVGYVVIPPHAVAITISDLTLVAVA